MGHDESNQQCLEAALRYLYNKHNQGGHNVHSSLKDWEEEWTCTEKSNNSPQQRKGNDRGIFTLISLTLLSQVTRLQAESYSQDLIYI